MPATILKLVRPPLFAGVHDLAGAYYEGVQEGDAGLMQDFAEYLADEGSLGAYPGGMTLDMTVRQLVERYIHTSLGREVLKEWAQDKAEWDLEA